MVVRTLFSKCNLSFYSTVFQYSSAMSVFFCWSLPSIGQTSFWLFLCNCAHMASMLKSPLNWYGFLQVSFNKAASWEAVRQLFSNVWLWLACPLGQLSDRITLHFSMKYIKQILEKVGKKNQKYTYTHKGWCTRRSTRWIYCFFNQRNSFQLCWHNWKYF